MPTSIQYFVTTQLDYYIEEIDTFLLIAKEHSGVESLNDTVFGVIVGCVYTGFIHAHSAQSLSPNTDSVIELHNIIRERTKDIQLAIQGSRQRCQV